MIRCSVKYYPNQYDDIQEIINSGKWASNSHAARELWEFYKKNKPIIKKLEKRNEYLKGKIDGAANRK